MFMYLSTLFSAHLSVLNVFKYLTFRTGGATLTAVFLSFYLGPKIISWLKLKQKEGQPIRDDGPQSHFLKRGTPTMGGLLILLVLILSTVLWSDWKNPFVWIVMGVTLSFGLIGACDDYLKLTKRNSKGLSGKKKLALQIVCATVAGCFVAMYHPEGLKNALSLPFFKDVLWQFGWAYTAFTVFVMVGTSNAVNLTDGLDGLAIVPVMIAAGCFMLIAYLVGNHLFANYLQLNFIPGSGELAVFCGALVGSGIGFLWFNAPPAQVFMGDTGSLATGASLGAISVVTKHEIVLSIIGGLFVLEAASVMVQVIYYKLTHKRIFLMAPIHHHFEKKGWAEPTIVIRFWIIAFILAIIGLSTLKLR
jgi:phospho-N-acetylmuramoyl-pentapeptide-transferase